MTYQVKYSTDTDTHTIKGIPTLDAAMYLFDALVADKHFERVELIDDNKVVEKWDKSTSIATTLRRMVGEAGRMDALMLGEKWSSALEDICECGSPPEKNMAGAMLLAVNTAIKDITVIWFVKVRRKGNIDITDSIETEVEARELYISHVEMGKADQVLLISESCGAKTIVDQWRKNCGE